ncbi:hypothetical protein [Chromobacterium vaccinii]|uniref:hypothetical protein n=1 Tax=Chromobacterium vaccinii TaxID=1108595 RepID=UPI000E13097E|nr:hypothetical protein [Chromobacterium vaccinii]SUX54931.1 Uncharacterised protein [Chromobacterium vaccinii]
MPTESGLALPYARPAVRDLAFLLTSPSPWLCGADLPPERLLGPDGEALLARLDHAPAELEAWLAAAPPNGWDNMPNGFSPSGFARQNTSTSSLKI